MAVYKGDNHGKEAVASAAMFHANSGMAHNQLETDKNLQRPKVMPKPPCPPGVHPDSPGYGHKVPRK